MILCMQGITKRMPYILCSSKTKERSKHSYFALPNPLSCFIINDICLNQRQKTHRLVVATAGTFEYLKICLISQQGWFQLRE